MNTVGLTLLLPLLGQFVAQPPVAVDAALPGGSTLRAAVEDLGATFPRDFPRAAEFLGRLAALEQRWLQSGTNQRQSVADELQRLKREALLANPLIVRQPILFVTRAPFINDHGTEETMYQSILVSRMLAAGSREMGLFVVDVFGNEVLLHQESPGCFEPMPLAARPRPPVIPQQADPAAEDGTFYVYSVYRGARMETVQPGTVKAIRVVEAPAKLSYPPPGHGDWNAPRDGESHHPTAVNWNHYNTKRVLGTVPVEPDGSAHFRAPAGRFLYFQLLDERGMLVQSMRSGTTLQPGERQGCVGCHDYRSTAAAGDLPLALRRAPSTLRPWHGPPRDFSYVAEVQPVLDRQCVRCHDYGQTAPTVNLSGDLGVVFNASYVALMARSPDVWTPPVSGEMKPLVSSIGAGPVPVVGPYSWGSHRSRLVDLLQAGHEQVRLSPEELDRIITWIDLNAPYYPDHVDYYTGNTFGRSPLDHAQLLRLGQLVLTAPGGKDLGWNAVNNYTGSPLGQRMVSGELPIDFTRPELSACLRAFPDPADGSYREALALIRAGQERLTQHPRADMPGCVPCEADRQRLDYYAQRRRVDEQNREAIRQGGKAYDPPAAAR